MSDLRRGQAYLFVQHFDDIPCFRLVSFIIILRPQIPLPSSSDDFWPSAIAGVNVTNNCFHDPSSHMVAIGDIMDLQREWSSGMASTIVSPC